VLADVARGIGVPVYAVLGNHDWHANRHEELVSALRGGGIHVLERASEVVSVGGVDVGIVGTKGFIGGFTGSLLPDFGEPLLRRVYAETSAESRLDRGFAPGRRLRSPHRPPPTTRRRSDDRWRPRRS
jgi:Icc-related predicted phosphoesterase